MRNNITKGSKYTMGNQMQEIQMGNIESGETARESHTRLALHFEQTPVGVIEWDTELNVVRWNPSAEKIFGYKKDDAIGKNGMDLIVPDSTRNVVTQIWQQLIQAKGGTRSTNENIRRDGKIILCDWYNTPLVNEEGCVIGISSLVADITKRENAQKIQKALYQISEAAHTIEDIDQLYEEIHKIVSRLMKADNFYIALYDDDKDEISFPYFVDEFDSPPEPCKLGRGLTDYVLRTGQDMLIDAEEDLALRRQGVTDLVGPSAKIWLGVTLNLDGKAIGVIVVQDYENENAYGEEEKQLLTYVSEQIASAIKRKIDEKELKRYSDELKELNASKDKFFSIVAHDLRSPFHGLLGLSNLLKNDFDLLSTEEVKEYINEIQSSTSDLFNLIENLLDWSRIQTGNMPFEPKELDCGRLVLGVESILRYSANLKSIKIDNKIDLGIKIYADELMIRSLFHNLLSNAIKFTPNNGTINLSYEKSNEDKVKFSVKDSGIGIESENIEKLFKIDENFSTLGTNKEKGTGLGLPICKEIVEQHGSTLNVESKKGEGTCFSFSLNQASKNQ